MSDHDDLEWERRTLCPDDTCIGTLDDSGTCRTCGAQGDVPPPTTTESEVSSADEHDLAAEESESPSNADPPTSDPGDEEDEWDRRALCPDDTCIGTLDESGTCRVCGCATE